MATVFQENVVNHMAADDLMADGPSKIFSSHDIDFL